MEKKHGGIRKGQGRKSKAEEQNLIEKLTPLDKIAFKALKKALEQEQSWAVKLYFDYKFGKPRETKDINMTNDIIIDLSEWE
jgi:hypothetical protein